MLFFSPNTTCICLFILTPSLWKGVSLHCLHSLLNPLNYALPSSGHQNHSAALLPFNHSSSFLIVLMCQWYGTFDFSLFLGLLCMTMDSLSSAIDFSSHFLSISFFLASPYPLTCKIHHFGAEHLSIYLISLMISSSLLILNAVALGL